MGGWVGGRVWEGGGAVNLHMHIVLHIHKHTLHFNSGIHIHVHVHVHEQSYYIVHYITRKEEGKEGRKKRTNTNNLHQPRRLRRNICVRTPV